MIKKFEEFINEGIESNWLKLMIKRHGGIDYMTNFGKSLMLDKPGLHSNMFFVDDEIWRETPYELKDFCEIVFYCGDRSVCCMIKPEHKNDDALKERITRYIELQKQRTENKTEINKKPKRNGKNDAQTYLDKKAVELAKEYNAIIIGDIFFIPVDDVWSEEAYNIEKKFRRYGYGVHEDIYFFSKYRSYEEEAEELGYTVDKNKQYLAITYGYSSFFEGDDTAAGGPYGWYNRGKIRPTIFSGE